MKYLSLFSGIGGFELGIGDSAECIGFSEIDPYAISVYQRHFPKHKNYGDITTIDETKLPQFDLLVGGFPCQSFSVAGRRRGFDDKRGTMFFEIARIIREKCPRFLLFENVKGLLSHDQGETFGTILKTLAELGYDAEWQVLNSKNFGVPQRRERVFIVGYLRGIARPEVFPITGSNPNHLKEITSEVSDAQRIYDARGLGKTLKALGGGLGAKTGLYMIQRARGKNLGNTSNVAPTITGKSYQDNNFVAMTERRTPEAKEMRREAMKHGHDWSPRRGKELIPREDGIANTLTATQGREQLLTDGTVIRKPTPIECERLQGFPDNWTAGHSDSQRYKMLGNAVTVNVVAEIAKQIC